MVTDYPSGATLRQPQSPPTVQTQRGARLQLSLTFSKDMSSEQLALWLRNHPSLSEGEYEEDISKLRGTLPNTVLIIMVVIILLLYLDARINGHVFLSLNESQITQLGISLGFKFAIMNIIEGMVSSWESLCSTCSIISTWSCYVATEKQPSTSQ